MERSHRRQTHACCQAAAQHEHAISSGVYQTLLLLGAIMLWVMLFAAIASVGGCSKPCQGSGGQPGSRAQATCYKNVRFIPVLVQASDLRPSLIFPADPELTPVPAEAFTRSDWPTTPGRYDAGQSVSYQESWYDSQGLSSYTPNYGYRTFMIQRNGTQTGP